MDYDREKGDEKGLETATGMRDDFQDLANRLNAEDYKITKEDTAKLLVGAMIQANQLQDRINNLKQALSGYQSDIIPKLQAVLEAEDEEAAFKLAEEKFIIEDNN